MVLEGLFRRSILGFHFLPVANLSDPFQNDLVFHVNSALDDKNVVQFVLEGDQALMRHMIVADDPDVALVENLERGPLRDDDGVPQLLVDQNGAGLTVPQQAVRVREIRAEGDVSGLVVESGLDRTDLAEMRELACGSPA